MAGDGNGAVTGAGSGSGAGTGGGAAGGGSDAGGGGTGAAAGTGAGAGSGAGADAGKAAGSGRGTGGDGSDDEAWPADTGALRASSSGIVVAGAWVGTGGGGAAAARITMDGSTIAVASAASTTVWLAAADALSAGRGAADAGSAGSSASSAVACGSTLAANACDSSVSGTYTTSSPGRRRPAGESPPGAVPTIRNNRMCSSSARIRQRSRLGWLTPGCGHGRPAAPLNAEPRRASPTGGTGRRFFGSALARAWRTGRSKLEDPREGLEGAHAPGRHPSRNP